MARDGLRGFTLRELIVLTVLFVVVTAVLISIAFSQRSMRGHQHALKDSTQVRGIHQAMLFWAQNNKDQSPLPSLIDLNNDTVAEQGFAKDTTANIFSMLIYNGSLSTEIFVSPAEASSRIALCDAYEFANPKAAVNPAKALWDPAFNADWTGNMPANNSYAHHLPDPGRRTGRWSESFSANTPIVGNRGPEVSFVAYDTRGTAIPTFALGDKSLTFLILGTRSRWEGHVAFADNHSEYVSTTIASKYTAPNGRLKDDVLFFDEPDDASGTNAFLGIFIKAGATRGEFKAIWD